MARRVFFSFHYQLDIFRVNQIRNIPNITGCAAAGFQDASIWEDEKKKGEEWIKALIRKELENTTVTVVCIGSKTAGRMYIDYEIEQSIARQNGIVALRINHLKHIDGSVSAEGAIPSKLSVGGFVPHKYHDAKSLERWIEDAATSARK